MRLIEKFECKLDVLKKEVIELSDILKILQIKNDADYVELYLNIHAIADHICSMKIKLQTRVR